MEDLLKPDFGVTILTICNFLLLVYLLKKFAWKGLIGALEKREQQIASDKQQAQEAREAAQQLKADLEEKLNCVAKEATQKIAEAVSIGKSQQNQLLADAQAQTARLLEQAHQQIEAEKKQALAEVRQEIVRTAVLAAQKVVQQQISAKSAAEAVDRVLAEIKQK
ncbi:MAG: F0F1 ATP synthase subunit B [Elusimicrobiaceae bacterium]|nr:F0F1 ATP synthase subunit B [Elusimicrobiaceae bacterium]